MNINKLIPLFFISFIFSQFVNMQVSVEYNELDSDYHLKKNIVEDLDSDIEDYFLLNKFCYEYDFIQLELKLHLIIESISTLKTSSGTINSVKSHILITNNTDQYYFIKGVNFEYNKNKALIFNPYKFDGIEAILNYYAFLFIGYELDTWGNNLGTTYLNKALEISSEANQNANWKLRSNEIKSIIGNAELRRARLLYFSYYDMMRSKDFTINSNEFIESTRATISELYTELFKIYTKMGYDKNTIKFIESISDKLPEIFYSYNMNEAIEFLILFNPDNENKYINYLK